MYELSIETSFSAAHCLRGHPGRCARMHGHNYRVIIVVQAGELNDQGMVIDFADLKEICQQVVDPLDHTLLNDLPAFSEQNPTAERLAHLLFTGLTNRIADLTGGRVTLDHITVYESERSCVTYRR